MSEDPHLQANALFEFLHDRFLAHPDYAVHRFEVRGNQRFLVQLEDKRVTFLRIEQGVPLLLFFWTMRDLHKLRALPGLKRSPYGRMFEVPGQAFNLNFDRAVGIDPSLIEPNTLFEALTQIAADSSMRKLLPRADDPATVTRLRDYYLSDGEWEAEHSLENWSSILTKPISIMRLSAFPRLTPGSRKIRTMRLVRRSFCSTN